MGPESAITIMQIGLSDFSFCPCRPEYLNSPTGKLVSACLRETAVSRKQADTNFPVGLFRYSGRHGQNEKSESPICMIVIADSGPIISLTVIDKRKRKI